MQHAFANLVIPIDMLESEQVVWRGTFKHLDSPARVEASCSNDHFDLKRSVSIHRNHHSDQVGYDIQDGKQDWQRWA